MSYILAVFNTRSETLYFANILKSQGLVVSVSNTPRSVGQGCSICVKFLPSALPMARNVLTQKTFQGFLGFFSVVTRGGIVVEFDRIK